MTVERTGTLDRGDGEHVAWRMVEGRGPTVVWLGGFRSDMTGTKAEHLAARAAERGRSFLRFDWFAHGASSGAWEAATVGRWRQDAVAVIDAVAQGPLVLVGSSMGGWMACLAALDRPERVAGLVLIAPAPDFTEALMRPSLSPEQQRELEVAGACTLTPEHEPPYGLSARFFEEAKAHAILGGPVPITAPVRVLQGARDEAVPWRHAWRLCERLTGEDVVFTLIKDGDHRLSRPQDLARLDAAVAEPAG